MAFVLAPACISRRKRTSARCSRVHIKCCDAGVNGNRQGSSGIPENRGHPAQVSTEEMIRQDLEQLKLKKRDSKETESTGALLETVQGGISSLLLWDFFLIVGLLGWLLVALIPHFAAENDVLLDPWLQIWQPFTQPALGVLMVGTILQGTISFIAKKK